MNIVDLAKVNIIALSKAVLCENCQTISDSVGEACVVCGSHSLLNIACVLDRDRFITDDDVAKIMTGLLNQGEC